MSPVSLLKTETKTLEGQTVRLAVRRAGPGQPTALFVHGYPDTLQIFAATIAALPAGWGYVAADFPGQGQSARSSADTPTTSPEERARWLGVLLDACLLTSVRIFAHDMGAHAALELARLRPRRIERLVLAHSLLDGRGPTSSTILWLRKSAAYKLLLPAFPGRVVRKCLEAFLAPNQQPAPLVVRDLERSFTMHVGKHTADVCDAAESWLKRGLARYAALPMPVTLLVGTRNLQFPREHAEALARVVPQARIVDVPDAWHWLAWQAPSAVADALAE